MLAKIRDCSIEKYSIFLHEPDCLMFAYYEYTGEDHDLDIARMAKDETTQKWWSLCKPMMEPLPSRGVAKFWASMDQIFFMEY